MASDVEKYEKALMRLRAKAYPYAALRGNNELGEEMWRQWRVQYMRTMTLRNKWTVNSIKLIKSKRPIIEGMRVIVGTRLQYLKTNEDGGVATPKEGRTHGMMNPAKAARKGGSYKGLVPSGTKNGPKGLKGRDIGNVVGGDRKKRNAAQIRQAQKDSSKLAMIEGDGGEIGFYKLRKGKGKKNKKGDWEPKGIRMWGLTKGRVIQKNPAMRRASKIAVGKMDGIMIKELRAEIAEVIRRYGLNGSG